MSDDLTPVFQIQRVYLKDLSLEQPNSPAILTSQEQPSVDIQLGVGMEQVADGDCRSHRHCHGDHQVARQNRVSGGSQASRYF